jgi:predicted phage-related endonuclease
MTHTKAWHARRLKTLGASDATIVMAGTPERRLHLNHVKRKLKADDNLDDILAVQLGNVTEDLNRRWLSRELGVKVVFNKKTCEHQVHPQMDFLGCNLDGRAGEDIAELKFHGGYSTLEELATKYIWQIQHQLNVTNTDRCHLGVIYGAHARYEWCTLDRDPDLIAQLVEQECLFWADVEADRDPGDAPEIVAKVALDDMRTVDMTTGNAAAEWTDSATNWRTCKPYAVAFKDAEKALKELIADDVKHAHGAGIAIKRSKNGALRIGEQK